MFFPGRQAPQIGGSNKQTNSPFYNPNGKFVLLRVDGKTLVRIASMPIGTWSQGLAFSADGRSVLVQNAAERQIQVFSINNEQLQDTGQKLQLKGHRQPCVRLPRMAREDRNSIGEILRYASQITRSGRVSRQGN